MLEFGADFSLGKDSAKGTSLKVLMVWIFSKKGATDGGFVVVGHMRSSKEFPCYQSVARDSAITSADSHWTANRASRPGIPTRILQQFAKLEVPTGIVTKAVMSHKLKWK